MAFVTKIRPYAIISLDLTGARTNGAEGAITLRGDAVSPWVANTITILDLDGGSLDFRLGDVQNDAVTAEDGLKVEGGPFREIYWTNSAQAGKTAKIFVAWVD